MVPFPSCLQKHDSIFLNPYLVNCIEFLEVKMTSIGDPPVAQWPTLALQQFVSCSLRFPGQH